jgi:hypothetical protein
VSNKIYAAFDEVLIGPGLSLTAGDLILTTSLVVDAHRMARSQYAVVLPSYVEMIPHSPNLVTGEITVAPSLLPVGGVPPLCYGVCTADALLKDFVGHDAFGYGYCPGDGWVYHNNAQLQFVGVSALNDVNGIFVDPISAVMIVTRRKVPLGNPVPIDASKAWFYAGTVSGNPGDRGICANPGLTPLRHPPTGVDGFWIPGPQIPPINIATEDYMSAAADVRRHEKFKGDINSSAQPATISDGVRFWMFGNSAPASLSAGSLVQLQLDDPNGIYDALTTDAAKNEPATLMRLKSNSAFSTMETVFVGVVDHAEPDTRQTKQLYLRDGLARLDVAMRRPLYPPGSDQSSAGKPVQEMIGPSRNYEGDLVNAVTKTYQLASSPLSGFGRCRQAGKQIVLNADFFLTEDMCGVTMVNDPVGKTTFETTSYGNVFDPLALDYLEGVGVFGSYAATVGGPYAGYPDGWVGGNYGVIGFSPAHWQISGVAPNKVLTEPNLASAISWLVPPGPIVIHANRSYAFRLQVDAFPVFGQFTDANGQTLTFNPAQFVFGYLTGTPIAYFNFLKIHLDRTGTISGVFVNNTGSDQNLVCALLSNEVVYTGAANNYFVIGSAGLVINEQPPIAESVTLDGPGLTDIAKALLIDRGPVLDQELKTNDTDAIDTATGYIYFTHLTSSDSLTVREVVKPIFDSSTSAIICDDDGLFGVLRLFRPEDVDDGDLDWELSDVAGDFDGEVFQYADMAENLTTRMVGGPNIVQTAQSEYGDNTSLSDVPLSMRALLARKYQWEVTAGVPLANRYREAMNRPPFVSSLDRKEDGQHAITYANGLYKVERNFYVAKTFEPYGRRYQKGQVCRVHCKRHATLGKVVILGRQRTPDSELCELTFWGM